MLSDIHVNQIKIRRELKKTDGKQESWVLSHMDACDLSWKFIMSKKLIQCNSISDWFTELNRRVMEPVCNDRGEVYSSSELGVYRSSDQCCTEDAMIDYEEIDEKMNSLFSCIEEADKKYDDSIMPHRINLGVATTLASIAWKLQFQIGYICPFFQGNWCSARIFINTLRCHWSLPWLTFNYEEHDDKEDVGRTYKNEILRWFDLFDREGVLTDKFIN